MTAFVLDASVAVSWCFPGDPEEIPATARRILGLLATNDAIVPEIWAFEIDVDLEALSRAWNLSSYDAAYLDLALRKGVPLATIDRDLKNAAVAQGIEVVS
jgi:predicted nucleic acid-binding protein